LNFENNGWHALSLHHFSYKAMLVENEWLMERLENRFDGKARK
jgi:hypothetical protein